MLDALAATSPAAVLVNWWDQDVASGGTPLGDDCAVAVVHLTAPTATGLWGPAS